MKEKAQKKIEQEPVNPLGFYYSISDGSGIIQDHPDLIQPVAGISLTLLSRPERLKLAIDQLQIGRRVREELRDQGRTVGWLAKQLDMERTSLYYTFRQNSIDLGMLVRISFYLEHNFIQDIDNVYKSFGL